MISLTIAFLCGEINNFFHKTGFYYLLGVSCLTLALPAAAQDLNSSRATITVLPGTTLYVGSGGLANQAGTITNDGILRVDGPLTNAGMLALSTDTLEVRGDVANTGTVLPGTSPVTFSGTTDQMLTPSGVPSTKCW